MTPDDVIVSRHYLRGRARRLQREFDGLGNGRRYCVKKAHRGPHRWYVVRRPGT